MNNQKISLTQKYSLYLKNPLRKNVKGLLVCVPFSLGSICKYWIYVVDDIGVFRIISSVLRKQLIAKSR